MRLANKTAFITGGNSGIGLATAKLFVAEGAKVIITGRNKETLEAAGRELGPNALAVVADTTDIAATEAARAAALAFRSRPLRHRMPERGRCLGMGAARMTCGTRRCRCG